MPSENTTAVISEDIRGAMVAMRRGQIREINKDINCYCVVSYLCAKCYR